MTPKDTFNSIQYNLKELGDRQITKCAKVRIEGTNCFNAKLHLICTRIVPWIDVDLGDGLIFYHNLNYNIFQASLHQIFIVLIIF